MPLWIDAPQQTSSASPDETNVSSDHPEIRERLESYVAAFNQHDAAAVSNYWTTDGVSVAAESGERTEGRAAL